MTCDEWLSTASRSINISCCLRISSLDGDCRRSDICRWMSLQLHTSRQNAVKMYASKTHCLITKSDVNTYIYEKCSKFYFLLQLVYYLELKTFTVHQGWQVFATGWKNGFSVKKPSRQNSFGRQKLDFFTQWQKFSQNCFTTAKANQEYCSKMWFVDRKISMVCNCKGQWKILMVYTVVL